MAKKNKRVLIIVASAVLLLTVITVAYAYFIASVQTVNEQTVVAETGTMRLIMTDGNAGWSEVWDFGESKSKTFTLQNTGSLPVTVDLYWKNLVNTFLEGSMVYSLKQTTDTSVETYLVGSASTFENIPTSTVQISNKKIASNITVPANKTYTYTLTIQLVNSPTVDQTADLNANFYTEFDIKEYESTFANYIKDNVYGTDTTLYLHSDTATGNNETSIANWTNAESGNANDGAYRYSGPDASVHNYICFGTDDKDACLNDTSDNGNSKYLFRIISVEGDNVKIIKALPLYNTKTSAATFRWDYEGSTDTSTFSNSWSKPSTLKEYLNTGTSSRANYSSNYPDVGYLQSWDSTWQSKIADNMIWYVGGYNSNNSSARAKTFYNAEHGMCSSGTCPGTTDTTTKIGLMNLYDYGYAASPTSWTTVLNYYDNSTIKASNWLYRSTNSSYEWTITPYSSNAYGVFYVSNRGTVGGNYAYGYAVRPVLYLASDVVHKSGTGTSTDPFLIS